MNAVSLADEEVVFEVKCCLRVINQIVKCVLKASFIWARLVMYQKSTCYHVPIIFSPVISLDTWL